MTRKWLGWCTNMQRCGRLIRWCTNMWWHGRHRWCTNMQWHGRHRWCMNMRWNRRFINCKIWQSFIRVHWCMNRNLRCIIICTGYFLCFIFTFRAILRFTGVATAGYVRVADDIPLQVIRGV